MVTALFRVMKVSQLAVPGFDKCKSFSIGFRKEKKIPQKKRPINLSKWADISRYAKKTQKSKPNFFGRLLVDFVVVVFVEVVFDVVVLYHCPCHCHHINHHKLRMLVFDQKSTLHTTKKLFFGRQTKTHTHLDIATDRRKRPRGPNPNCVWHY